jgi:ribosomal protein S18 acetylase RimI-like enzyme
MDESATDSLDDRIGAPQPDDAAAIGDLFLRDMEHLGLDADRERLDEVAAQVIEASRRDPPDCLCWVARIADADQPVGVLLANFHWSLKFEGRSLWIEELFVAPEYRQRGLGRALVQQVEAYARQEDLKGIDLEAYQGNTPASVLYRTEGFHRLGRERFYKRLDGRAFL